MAQAPPSEPIGTRDIDLDAAREHQLLHARAHLERGGVDGLEAGGAEAVELHARDGVGQAGGDGGGLGDVAALVADRGDDAEHDVVDLAGSSSGCRARISSIRPTTSDTGFTSYSDPEALPRPRGVRRASKTYASGISAMNPCNSRLSHRSR